MKIEYEATFPNIDKTSMRERLRASGAKIVKAEFLQKRIVFHLPAGHEIQGGWARVRDEGDKITMSIKVVDGSSIVNQKESYLEVNDFNEAVQFLKILGCREKAYQESKRELWKFGNVEVAIDEWPFLEPFAEIEGVSEKAVKNVAEKLGFEWTRAKFCAVGTLYGEKYNLPEHIINNEISRIVFEMENPFVTARK